MKIDFKILLIPLLITYCTDTFSNDSGFAPYIDGYSNSLSNDGTSPYVRVVSPNKQIGVALYKKKKNKGVVEWYLKTNYYKEGNNYEVIPEISLGLKRSDQEFSRNLEFLKASKSRKINEDYTALHGKRSHRNNAANEIVVSFENSNKAKINLVLRAYNDGAAFRYEFPEKDGSYVVQDEFTSYLIPDSTERWLQKFDLSNENLYSQMSDDSLKQNWGYPALFKAVASDSC